MPIAQGFSAVSFFDTSDGTTVQVEPVADDNSFYDEIDLDAPVDSDSNSFPGGKRHELHVRFVDEDGSLSDQLKTWRQAGTRIQAVALASGGGRNVQWYEDTRISSVKPVPISARTGCRSDMWDVVLMHEAVDASIYSNVNLLAFLGWADADSDGVPDGYTSTYNTDDFTGGVYTGTTAATGSPQLSASFAFPIEGASLTMSALYSKLHANTDQVQLIAKSFAGSTLSTGSKTLSATGRGGPDALTLPASVYTIQAVIARVTGVAQIDTQKVADPAVRVDDSTTYVAY